LREVRVLKINENMNSVPLLYKDEKRGERGGVQLLVALPNPKFQTPFSPNSLRVEVWGKRRKICKF
jgi:hypothetical protein